jgi:hypothetical protein
LLRSGANLVGELDRLLVDEQLLEVERHGALLLSSVGTGTFRQESRK